MQLSHDTVRPSPSQWRGREGMEDPCATWRVTDKYMESGHGPFWADRPRHALCLPSIPLSIPKTTSAAPMARDGVWLSGCFRFDFCSPLPATRDWLRPWPFLRGWEQLVQRVDHILRQLNLRGLRVLLDLLGPGRADDGRREHGQS